MEKGVIFYGDNVIPFEEDGVNVTMTILGFSQIVGKRFKEFKIVYEKDVGFVGEDDINQDDYKVVKK
jgi:hypothetical protein